MATIGQLIQTQEVAAPGDTLRLFRQHPEFVDQVFQPLLEAGFRDFTYVGQGSNALLVAPADNPDIVFRIGNEPAGRRSDIPFFLSTPYQRDVSLPGHGQLKLEILLAGEKEVPRQERDFLQEQMAQAGWQMNTKMPEIFWKDVVMVLLRDGQSRMRKVPIISDPSAYHHYFSERQPLPKTGNGGALMPVQRNTCSADYVTLQDQAAAYQAVIDGDPRLKQLIPKPVSFPETEILASPQAERLP